MIKFYRKIRQKMLVQNKFSNYLIYAIGEIVLVVIGILIALALNNWNENRKEKITEIQLYKEIKDDLVFSLRDLKSGLKSHNEDYNHTIKLRDHIKKKFALNDSISLYMRTINRDDQFFPRTSGFEALKSIGFKTLSNDTLRENITNLFQLGFERIVGMGRDKAPVRNFEFLNPFMDKYLRLSDSTFYRELDENHCTLMYKREIANYDNLLNDELLLLKLQDAISIRGFKIRYYNRIIGWTKSLISEIEFEIKSLKK